MQFHYFKVWHKNTERAFINLTQQTLSGVQFFIQEDSFLDPTLTLIYYYSKGKFILQSCIKHTYDNEHQQSIVKDKKAKHAFMKNKNNEMNTITILC